MNAISTICMSIFQHIQRISKTVCYICSVLAAKENTLQKKTLYSEGWGDIFYPGVKLLNYDLVKRGGSKAGMGQARLNECLKPFTNFQSGPFARAHRISAWPHGRPELSLGKADTMQRRSQAEQTSPQRHKVRKTPKPSSSMGPCLISRITQI